MNILFSVVFGAALGLCGINLIDEPLKTIALLSIFCIAQNVAAKKGKL